MKCRLTVCGDDTSKILSRMKKHGTLGRYRNVFLFLFLFLFLFDFDFDFDFEIGGCQQIIRTVHDLLE